MIGWTVLVVQFGLIAYGIRVAHLATRASQTARAAMDDDDADTLGGYVVVKILFDHAAQLHRFAVRILLVAGVVSAVSLVVRLT